MLFGAFGFHDPKNLLNNKFSVAQTIKSKLYISFKFYSSSSNNATYTSYKIQNFSFEFIITYKGKRSFDFELLKDFD